MLSSSILCVLLLTVLLDERTQVCGNHSPKGRKINDSQKKRTAKQKNFMKSEQSPAHHNNPVLVDNVKQVKTNRRNQRDLYSSIPESRYPAASDAASFIEVPQFSGFESENHVNFIPSERQSSSSNNDVNNYPDWLNAILLQNQLLPGRSQITDTSPEFIPSASFGIRDVAVENSPQPIFQSPVIAGSANNSGQQPVVQNPAANANNTARVLVPVDNAQPVVQNPAAVAASSANNTVRVAGQPAAVQPLYARNNASYVAAFETTPAAPVISNNNNNNATGASFYYPLGMLGQRVARDEQSQNEDIDDDEGAQASNEDDGPVYDAGEKTAANRKKYSLNGSCEYPFNSRTFLENASRNNEVRKSFDSFDIPQRDNALFSNFSSEKQAADVDYSYDKKGIQKFNNYGELISHLKNDWIPPSDILSMQGYLEKRLTRSVNGYPNRFCGDVDFSTAKNATATDGKSLSKLERKIDIFNRNLKLYQKLYDKMFDPNETLDLSSRKLTKDLLVDLIKDKNEIEGLINSSLKQEFNGKTVFDNVSPNSRPVITPEELALPSNIKDDTFDNYREMKKKSKQSPTREKLENYDEYDNKHYTNYKKNSNEAAMDTGEMKNKYNVYKDGAASDQNTYMGNSDVPKNDDMLFNKAVMGASQAPNFYNNNRFVQNQNLLLHLTKYLEAIDELEQYLNVLKSSKESNKRAATTIADAFDNLPKNIFKRNAFGGRDRRGKIQELNSNFQWDAANNNGLLNSNNSYGDYYNTLLMKLQSNARDKFQSVYDGGVKNESTYDLITYLKSRNMPLVYGTLNNSASNLYSYNTSQLFNPAEVKNYSYSYLPNVDLHPNNFYQSNFTHTTEKPNSNFMNTYPDSNKMAYRNDTSKNAVVGMNNGTGVDGAYDYNRNLHQGNSNHAVYQTYDSKTANNLLDTYSNLNKNNLTSQGNNNFVSTTTTTLHPQNKHNELDWYEKNLTKYNYNTNFVNLTNSKAKSSTIGQLETSTRSLVEELLNVDNDNNLQTGVNLSDTSDGGVLKKVHVPFFSVAGGSKLSNLDEVQNENASKHEGDKIYEISRPPVFIYYNNIPFGYNNNMTNVKPGKHLVNDRKSDKKHYDKKLDENDDDFPVNKFLNKLINEVVSNTLKEKEIVGPKRDLSEYYDGVDNLAVNVVNNTDSTISGLNNTDIDSVGEPGQTVPIELRTAEDNELLRKLHRNRTEEAIKKMIDSIEKSNDKSKEMMENTAMAEMVHALKANMSHGGAVGKDYDAESKFIVEKVYEVHNLTGEDGNGTEFTTESGRVLNSDVTKENGNLIKPEGKNVTAENVTVENDKSVGSSINNNVTEENSTSEHVKGANMTEETLSKNFTGGNSTKITTEENITEKTLNKNVTGENSTSENVKGANMTEETLSKNFTAENSTKITNEENITEKTLNKNVTGENSTSDKINDDNKGANMTAETSNKNFTGENSTKITTEENITEKTLNKNVTGENSTSENIKDDNKGANMTEETINKNFTGENLTKITTEENITEKTLNKNVTGENSTSGNVKGANMTEETLNKNFTGENSTKVTSENNIAEKTLNTNVTGENSTSEIVKGANMTEETINKNVTGENSTKIMSENNIAEKTLNTNVTGENSTSEIVKDNNKGANMTEETLNKNVTNENSTNVTTEENIAEKTLNKNVTGENSTKITNEENLIKNKTGGENSTLEKVKDENKVVNMTEETLNKNKTVENSTKITANKTINNNVTVENLLPKEPGQDVNKVISSNENVTEKTLNQNLICENSTTTKINDGNVTLNGTEGNSATKNVQAVAKSEKEVNLNKTVSEIASNKNDTGNLTISNSEKLNLNKTSTEIVSNKNDTGNSTIPKPGNDSEKLNINKTTSEIVSNKNETEKLNLNKTTSEATSLKNVTTIKTENATASEKNTTESSLELTTVKNIHVNVNSTKNATMAENSTTEKFEKAVTTMNLNFTEKSTTIKNKDTTIDNCMYQFTTESMKNVEQDSEDAIEHNLNQTTTEDICLGELEAESVNNTIGELLHSNETAADPNIETDSCIEVTKVTTEITTSEKGNSNDYTTDCFIDMGDNAINEEDNFDSVENSPNQNYRRLVFEMKQNHNVHKSNYKKNNGNAFENFLDDGKFKNQNLLFSNQLASYFDNPNYFNSKEQMYNTNNPIENDVTPSCKFIKNSSNPTYLSIELPNMEINISINTKSEVTRPKGGDGGSDVTKKPSMDSDTRYPVAGRFISRPFTSATITFVPDQTTLAPFILFGNGTTVSPTIVTSNADNTTRESVTLLPSMSTKKILGIFATKPSFPIIKKLKNNKSNLMANETEHLVNNQTTVVLNSTTVTKSTNNSTVKSLESSVPTTTESLNKTTMSKVTENVNLTSTMLTTIISSVTENLNNTTKSVSMYSTMSTTINPSVTENLNNTTKSISTTTMSAIVNSNVTENVTIGISTTTMSSNTTDIVLKVTDEKELEYVDDYSEDRNKSKALNPDDFSTITEYPSASISAPNVTNHVSAVPVPLKIEPPRNDSNNRGGDCDVTNSNCICAMGDVIDDFISIVAKAYSQEGEDIDRYLNSYTCTKFVNVTEGFYINGTAAPTVVRKKREARTPSRSQIDDLFTQIPLLKSSASHIFVKPGTRFEIPCMEEKTESNNLKFFWTNPNNDPVTDSSVQPEDGTLKVIAATADMDGNFTCVSDASDGRAASASGGRSMMAHQVSVVSVPRFLLQASVVYVVTPACNATATQTVELYSGKSLAKLLCDGGGAGNVCKVVVQSATCINQQLVNGLQLNVSVEVLQPAQLAKLNSTICNLNCELKIYTKLVQVLVENIPKVLHLPVRFRLPYWSAEMCPVVSASTPPSNVPYSSLEMESVCDAGFHLGADLPVLCVPCEPDTYNPGGWSECVPCPPYSFEHSKGATSCVKCTDLIKDPACYVELGLDSKYKYVIIGVALLILGLIVGLLLCFFKRGPPRKRVKKKRGVKKRAENVTAEEQLVGMLGERRDSKVRRKDKRISVNHPPKVPPPDF